MGPDFNALLAADLEAIRREFSVQGRPCWVELRPMDASASKQYQTHGLDYEVGPDAQPILKSFDMPKREAFLVSHTLVDFCLMKKAGKPHGEPDAEPVWAELRPTPAARSTPLRMQDFVEKELRPTKEFWAWLVAECETANGLTEEAQGNSADSSST